MLAISKSTRSLSPQQLTSINVLNNKIKINGKEKKTQKKLRLSLIPSEHFPSLFHLSFSPSISFMFTQSKGKKLLTKIQTKWNMLNHPKSQSSHQAKKTTNQHLHKHGNEKRKKTFITLSHENLSLFPHG